MKFLWILPFLFFFSAVVVRSQTNDTPEITIMRQKWRIEVVNPALDEDPFANINGQRQDENNRLGIIQENKLRARIGLPPINTKAIGTSVPESKSGSNITTFIYEAKFKNTGAKVIKTIVWDYVFADSDSKQEAGRLTFVCETNMKIGGSENFAMRSASPPAGTLNAKNASKKLRDQYLEQIIVQAIEYADGTFWKSPTLQKLSETQH